MSLSNTEAKQRARERMAAYRKTQAYQEWLMCSRELRRQLKAKYRRQAGARSREEIAAAGAEKQARAGEAKALRKALEQVHDAHVRRFRYVMNAREQYATRYARFPESERKRSADRKRALPDSYVAERLRSMGLPQEAINGTLIEMKRDALALRRLSREVKEAVFNYEKESHESITEHA